jgi:hypothetical protein
VRASHNPKATNLTSSSTNDFRAIRGHFAARYAQNLWIKTAPNRRPKLVHNYAPIWVANNRGACQIARGNCE